MFLHKTSQNDSLFLKDNDENGEPEVDEEEEEDEVDDEEEEDEGDGNQEVN